MTKFMIVGASHAIALRGGMTLLSETDPDRYRVASLPNSWDVGNDIVRVFTLRSARFEREDFSIVSDGRVQLIGDPALAMRRAVGTDRFDPSAVWAFANIVNTHRVFQHPMWRACAPSALGRVGDRTPLTEAVIRETLLAEQSPVRAFYARLAETGVPVVAAETPRLRRDVVVLRDKDERRIARWVDDLNRTMWQEYLDSLSVPYVAAPDDTVGADGFLASELRSVGLTTSGARDTHHANPEWGKKYLPRILEAMSSIASAR